MKNATLNTGILFFLAALAAFFDMGPAYAQENTPFKVAAEGLTLSPPAFEMTLKPGEETAHTIRVTNPTKNLIELYPSAGNFSSSGDSGQPKYEIGTTALESSSRFSIADWVSFYTPKIALLPEQVVEFRFRVKVPEDAEPGGHYGVVFLGTKPPEDKDPNSQVALSTMVGSLLLVRIPGDVREEARIEEFSAPWFFWTPPVDFTVFLRNTGNIHIRPQGEVALTDWRGQNIERIDINPKKGSVLPESRRNFDVTWNPDIRHFWDIPIGKFHATLSVAYGQSDQSISQDIAFWIIPKWFVITIGFFTLFLLIFITFLIMRKRRQKRLLRRKNTGFFPAFGKRASVIEDSYEPMKGNAIRSVTQNQKQETGNWMNQPTTEETASEPASTSSADTHIKNHSTIQPGSRATRESCNDTIIQRIREVNAQSKQFQHTQTPPVAPESPQALPPKNKKRRLI